MFESVARTRGSEQDSFVGVRVIDDELRVGGDSVQAGSGAQTTFGDVGEARRDVLGIHLRGRFVAYLARNGVGIDGIVVVLGCDLQSACGTVDGRKSVQHVLGAIARDPDEYGEVVGRIAFEVLFQLAPA